MKNEVVFLYKIESFSGASVNTNGAFFNTFDPKWHKKSPHVKMKTQLQLVFNL